MSTEFESELLKLPKPTLWQMFGNIFECLEDGKYEVTHPLKNLSLKQFSKVIEDLKKKKMEAQQEYLRTKKTTRGQGTGSKKVKLVSIPEEKKKSKTFARDGKKYYDPELSFFETCLTFSAPRVRVNALGEEKKEHLMVFFSQSAQIGKPALNALEKHLKSLAAASLLSSSTSSSVIPSMAVTNIMLISSGGATPTANGATIPLMRKNYNIQVFLHSSLMFNVTKHKLVRPHRRITVEERKELMKKFDLNETTINNLPSITIDDPLSLWHDFRVGEVIRIDHPGMGEKYRIVVEVVPT